MKTIDDFSVRRFSEYIKAKGRQAATIESYERDCRTFLQFALQENVDAGDISPQTLEDFKEHLRGKGAKDNSIRRSVIGVRQFFRFLQDDEQWSHSPFDEVAIPIREEAFNHRLTPAHMDQLLAAARQDSSPFKVCRDLVMLCLLGLEGLKTAELIALQWNDFLRSGEGGYLQVEGNKARTIQLESDSALALESLRDLLRSKELVDFSSPKAKIMLGFKGAESRHMDSGLSRHGVKFALYELGQAVGISHLNSEDLRHYAMSHKVSLGFTPERLMNHLGLRTPGKISRHFRSEVQERVAEPSSA